MPDECGTIQMSPDQQFIIATGTYKPRVKCFEVNNLSIKFERCFDSEVVRTEVLSDDYSKMVRTVDWCHSCEFLTVAWSFAIVGISILWPLHRIPCITRPSLSSQDTKMWLRYGLPHTDLRFIFRWCIGRNLSFEFGAGTIHAIVWNANKAKCKCLWHQSRTSFTVCWHPWGDDWSMGSKR